VNCFANSVPFWTNSKFCTRTTVVRLRNVRSCVDRRYRYCFVLAGRQLIRSHSPNWPTCWRANWYHFTDSFGSCFPTRYAKFLVIRIFLCWHCCCICWFVVRQSSALSRYVIQWIWYATYTTKFFFLINYSLIACFSSWLTAQWNCALELPIYSTRGVHDTGIPMGPVGIPWEWEAETEFMGMGTGMGMVDRKSEGNGNSSLEEIPLVALVAWLAEQFATSS